MVAILAAIFNMVAKTHNKFRSAPMLQLQRKFDIYGFLEECDRDPATSTINMYENLRYV
jgi:hypothetical protein